MFSFMHGYLPGVWEAQVKAGLVGENDGVRFCQSIMQKDEMKFNRLAAKGGELYKLLSERRCPFYIDRLQGGSYIDEYPYDRELLDVYGKMLGENFWGFQMHEWMSNYRWDTFGKLHELPDAEWTVEGIEKLINEKYPFPYLFLESVTAREMASLGKPKNADEFCRNAFGIYKKRMETGKLIPCDSAYLAYAFEVSCGAKRLMPEVGAQTADARIQICYARGMTRKKGRSFGVYYEPWGGEPFTVCCYHREKKNEWGIGDSSDFPFDMGGPEGGSSRSLQRRIFLYGFLSGAEFMSEEWGICNVFYDLTDYELSPYGIVKKEFLDFTRKYTDVGEKLAPIAAVLPKEMLVLDNLYDDDVYCGFKEQPGRFGRTKQGLRSIFADSQPMKGSEAHCLKNSDIPDAVDILNEDDGDLSRYRYLIDLSGDGAFAVRHKNVCDIKDVRSVLCGLLPCRVEGGAHWLVNECRTGGYYLTVFNHGGIEKTSEGEKELPGTESVVSLEIRDGLIPEVLEGNGTFSCEDGAYRALVPAGGWLFIRLK